MIFTIDFNSDEALYVQLCNQIIMCIANENMMKKYDVVALGELLIDFTEKSYPGNYYRPGSARETDRNGGQIGRQHFDI